MSEIKKAEANRLKACPVCQNENTSQILKIPKIPIFCNLLLKNRKKALQVQKEEFHLNFCKNCGHIFNKAFNPDLMNYFQSYENSLHFSPHFQSYAQSLAEELIDRYDLHHKTMLEIGCGQGNFLRLLCQIGNNRGIGFDPSYSPDKNKKADNPEQITFIQDVYSKQYKDYKADFICCRQLLEHLSAPVEFLASLRNSFEHNPHTIFFFEVPYVLFTLGDLGIWDLIYEHPSYFSKSSLSFLFDSCGFSIKRIQERYHGQYLSIEASLNNENSLPETKELKSEDKIPGNERISSDYKELVSCLKTFHHEYKRKIHEWKSRLKKFENEGKKLILWGAGSKGVTFLNILNIQHQIKYVIDINSRKQDCYIPGTGQKILSPSFLLRHPPDVIVVMNPVYQQEIKNMTKNMDISPSFLIA